MEWRVSRAPSAMRFKGAVVIPGFKMDAIGWILPAVGGYLHIVMPVKLLVETEACLTHARNSEENGTE